MRSLNKDVFYPCLGLIKPLVWLLLDPCSCHPRSFLIRFSIKSHYERYNQLCLKPIIQFNLAWRCRDILRLGMAELFHNKVTRRVIREERKIIRHLKNMHAVVHMCTFLWGVRAGVYTNQANRFPANALLLLETVKWKSTWGNIIRMKILTVCLYTTLPLWPRRQNKKSGVTGRRRPVKLRLFPRVKRDRKASSRYIKRGARKHKSSFRPMLCFLGRWMIPIHPFPLPLKSNQLLAERWYYYAPNVIRVWSRFMPDSIVREHLYLCSTMAKCSLPQMAFAHVVWPVFFFFTFSFAFLLFHLLLFSADCKSGEKQLAVLIEDALLQGNKKVLLGL